MPLFSARLAAAMLLVLAGAVCLAAGPDSSSPPAFDRETAFARSQGAIGHVVGDHRFTTSGGAQLNLHALRGQPLVISLIYTSCHHTCPLITRSLARAVAAARDAFGTEGFHVLTVGFDPDNDTPARMDAYARGQRIRDPAWTFLSADADTARRLADDLGFLYRASSQGFDHLAQVSVVDGEMRVYTQIYGEEITTPALAEPLRRLALDLAAERPGLFGLLERVRLFCTVFDASSGAYRLDYTLIVAFVTGIVCLGGIATFVVRAWREHGRRDASA